MSFRAFALAQAQAPAELPVPDGFGVNIHFTDPRPGELDQLYAGGFRTVRMDFGWGGIERKKGEYDFSAYDRLVAALSEHHIRPYFILDYSNRNYDQDLSPHTDEGRAAFARWAAASATHFKGRGIVWEMYNEPNIQFWRPQPNADEYAKLALAVGKALREAQPNETYIGPATSRIDLPFIETCFKAGCLEYWSAVSVHPYRQRDPETATEEYRELRKLIAKYAPPGRTIPIISGEWGYSSAWEHFDEARQGKYLPRELLTNVASEIPLSIWYDWHDDGTNPKEGEHHFGTVHFKPVNLPNELYEPKPAYEAAKLLTTTLAGCTFSKRLFLGGKDDWLLLFQNTAGDPTLAAWTTALEPHEVTFAPGEKLRLTDTVQYIDRKKCDLLIIGVNWTRAPLDIRLAGPATARVQTVVRNPLERPITIVAGEKKIVLKQGESCPIIAEEPITRDAAGVTLDSVLEIEGAGRLVQRTNVEVSNPLRVSFFPPTHNTQQALLENETGDAIRARAELTGGEQPIVSELTTNAGETRAVLKFPLPVGSSKDRLSGLRLIGRGEQLLLDVKPARYEELSGFDSAAADWKLAADGDPKVGSEQSISQAEPPEGPPAPELTCFKIDYRFDKGWKFIRLVPDAKSAAIEGHPDALTFWLYGDGHETLARLRYVDSTGQTFQPDGGRISWKGWRQLTVPLRGGEASHWGGRDDGVVHFPIRFDTVLLLDSSKRQATSGEIYLAAPTMIYRADAP